MREPTKLQKYCKKLRNRKLDSSTEKIRAVIELWEKLYLHDESGSYWYSHKLLHKQDFFERFEFIYGKECAQKLAFVISNAHMFFAKLYQLAYYYQSPIANLYSLIAKNIIDSWLLDKEGKYVLNLSTINKKLKMKGVPRPLRDLNWRGYKYAGKISPKVLNEMIEFLPDLVSVPGLLYCIGVTKSKTRFFTNQKFATRAHEYEERKKETETGV